MSRPSLPNSPLVQVSSEVRFPGDLSLFSVWAAVQKDLRADFPKLLVPGAAPGTSPLLQHMKLTTSDQSEGLLLAINSFAFFVTRYQTFVGYERRARTIFDVFHQHARISAPTRFGLRYTNLIPPAQPGTIGGGFVHPMLKLRIEGLETPGNTTASQPQLILEREIGTLTLRVSISPQPDLMIPGLTLLGSGVSLDFDCYQSDPGTLEKMPEFMRASHQIIDDAFFSLITPEYLGYLQGGNQADG